MSIKSGRYVIINARHWNSAFLSDPNDGTLLVGSHEHNIVGDEWDVKKFPNGGYSIANFVYKMSASAEHRPPKGANVEGRKKDRIWRIKEHESGGKYTIATADEELRWCLEDSWPETPITLHDAPPSDTRCQWIFRKIGPEDIAAQETAKAEVEMVREEVAQAKAVAAENAARREEAELDASRKAAELEESKRETLQAKEDVVRKLVELEAARREAVSARAVAVENMARREEAEAEASRKATEVEEYKRETIRAKGEAARTLAELEAARQEVAQAKEEVERHKSSFKSYFSMMSQLGHAITNGLDNKQPRPIQGSLFWASEMGHGAATQLILGQEGVNINSKNSCGWTALSIASHNGHDAVVQLLLAKDGVDVNSKNSRGWTALSLAAQNGHHVVVKLLLAQEGIDVNSRAMGGTTALSFAAQNGHHAVARLLLAQEDVDFNSRNWSGWTALSLAAHNGHDAVVRLLREKIEQMGNTT